MASAKEVLERFKSRFARAKEVAEAKMQVAITAVEVTATAGVFAYMRGRYPTADKDGNDTNEISVMGIPVNLMTGIGLHGLGLVGVAGKYSEHAHNIGTGALADYAGQVLFDMGKKNREEAKNADNTPAVKGVDPNYLPSPAAWSPYSHMAQRSPLYAY